ncbi:dihydrofolate reductase family protein [Brevibacillus choshinensis]|uniref:dihydrofolate reductase family protein n=1 Tax=Brevibacillus choshinensis TaxID=54911 RepID=UPI002E1CCAAD|nr:dihydrofolate reductase family protein [Brevibacillus choshinensis]MED4754750.1 dihydrofolate reductase family protein [Brevibacillus choshinensis]
MNNSRLVKDLFAEEVAKMKQQPGKNIAMIASPGLVQTFMQLGLIDEYRINVNPVVLGGGVPLFKDIKHRINLKLAETKTFQYGVVGLVYQLEKKRIIEEKYEDEQVLEICRLGRTRCDIADLYSGGGP